MKNPDSIRLNDPIEDLVGKADQKYDPNAVTARHAKPGRGIVANEGDDGSKPRFKSSGDICGGGKIVSRNLVQIGDRPTRIVDIHPRRNFLKAASTSPSVAVPERSA